MDAFRKWLGTPRKLSEKIQERKYPGSNYLLIWPMWSCCTR